jgi:hypothetical protein
MNGKTKSGGAIITIMLPDSTTAEVEVKHKEETVGEC